MDILYIGDIPQDFHYAIFNNGYIDLYNTSVLHNGTYDYYRIYTNCNGFYYKQGQQQYSQYTTTYTQDIQISDSPVYRTDFPNILVMTAIFVLFGVWLLNIVTSLIRKGGVLGGLF